MAAQSSLRPPEDAVVLLYRYYLDRLRARLKGTTRTTRLLAGLLFVAGLLGGGEGGRRWWKRRRREREQGRRLLRRNSGLRSKDGSRTVFVPYKSSTAKVTIHPTKPTSFDAHRRLFLHPPRAVGLGDGQSAPHVPPPQVKPGLNLAFLHQFLSLLSIVVPRWNGKESALLLGHGVFLVLRTYLSLVVARLDGEIVRDLVAANGRAFVWGIVKWCGVGGLASYTNATIKFLQSKVSIAFRTRLTRYVHDLYLNDSLNYYRLTNLDGAVGQGADQFVTQDLTLFCASAASLYSSLGKPFVDLCVFDYQLFRSLGPLAFAGLMSNYFVTATLLRRLSPPFGKLKAVEGRREGDFRALHSRLVANAEEVAFYGGADAERHFLDRGFAELKGWMERLYGLRIRYNMLEDFVLKYSWSAFGYVVTSLPVFLPAWGGLGGVLELADARRDHGGDRDRDRDRMKDFVTNKRLMLSLADAGGRMMYSIKDLSELAGYTSRVYTLVSTLHRGYAGAYFPPRGGHAEPYSLADAQGTIHKGFDGVRLEHVPVVAPSLWPRGGDELVESLSVVVRPGEHLLISGANGVGKSAVARIVAGLWPVYRGLVSRPRSVGTDGIMFLPQRPYLSIGTLRDQVIYPHTEMDMRDGGRRDRELSRVLEEVRLGYLPDREGGWDTRKEWKDVLSGGEKQRMAMARLMYHEPRYAFLDEATSAVSSDVEGLLYERAKEKGITLITISTRAALKKHHTYNLTLGVDTGVGSVDWTLERIGTEAERLEADRELAQLRDRLSQVERWKSRRAAIERELGEVWIAGDDDGELEAPRYIKPQDTKAQEQQGPLEQRVSGPDDGVGDELVDGADNFQKEIRGGDGGSP